MKKWLIPAIILGALLLGTLIVLGSFFISELSSAFDADTTGKTSSVSAFKDTSSIESVSEESVSSEITEETTLEETTLEETTKEETTKKPTKETTKKDPTKDTSKKDPAKEEKPADKDPEKPKNPYKLSASHAFVYNQASDKFLYTYGSPTDPVAPASITKLFTAYVALKYLDTDTVITAGKEVSLIDKDSTRAWITAGQKVTVKTCIQGMLIPSGNDAAYVLAAAAGRKIAGDSSLAPKDAVAAFVTEMNAQAKKLGLTGTQFKNPDGIDEKGHYTCLKDLAVIANLALDNTLIRETAGTSGIKVKYASGETNTWYNTNKHIREAFPKYYRKTCVGLKTGSTDDAGYCLLSAFTYNGTYLIIGTMGCPEQDGRFEDTLKLYKAFT